MDLIIVNLYFYKKLNWLYGYLYIYIYLMYDIIYIHLLGKRVTLFFFFLLKFGSFFSIPALTFLDLDIDSSTNKLSIYKFSDRWKYLILFPIHINYLFLNLLLLINPILQDFFLLMSISLCSNEYSFLHLHQLLCLKLLSHSLIPQSPTRFWVS